MSLTVDWLRGPPLCMTEDDEVLVALLENLRNNRTTTVPDMYLATVDIGPAPDYKGSMIVDEAFPDVSMRKKLAEWRDWRPSIEDVVTTTNEDWDDSPITVAWLRGPPLCMTDDDRVLEDIIAKLSTLNTREVGQLHLVSKGIGFSPDDLMGSRIVSETFPRETDREKLMRWASGEEAAMREISNLLVHHVLGE